MKQIKELADYIENELDEACEYAKLALAYRGTDEDLAELYADMSKTALEKIAAMHTQVTKIIREHKNEAPPEMLAIWDYLHKKQIEQEAEVRRLQDMYRR